MSADEVQDQRPTQLRHVVIRDETTLLRESFVLFDDRGGIEAWRRPTTVGYGLGAFDGGVEIHSPIPLWEDHRPLDRCQWTETGTCFTDGSSLAFDTAQYYFDLDDLLPMRRYLTSWFEDRFGDVRTELVAR